jgi:PAS domain S-box-containing protein
LESLYRAIEQSADSIIITNQKGIIEYVNPAFESMTGYARETVIGHTPRILRSGVQSPGFYEALWSTILGGGTFRSTMTNRRQNGQLYYVDQTISPIRNSHGAITHFVSTGRDITQHKRAHEAAQRLNNQLELECERFAGILHDEAGQFLTAAHLILAAVIQDLPPAVGDRVQEVRGHLHRLEERLRQISHEMHPHLVADFGLTEAVRILCANFSRRSGVAVKLDASVQRRCAASVETVLYRMVQEALMNIGKHARASKATLTLAEQPTGLTCVIDDDGVGMNVDNVLNGRGGLGLRLMRDRIEAIGGTLSIAARDRGTELRAQVPLEV